MNTTSPITEISFNCPICAKKSKLAHTITHSDVFTVSCYFCHKETNVFCKTDSSGMTILVPEKEKQTFHKIELSFLPEETPLLKSPGSYAPEKIYKPLILNLTDTNSEVESIEIIKNSTSPTESIHSSNEKKGFFRELRDDLVEVLQIQSVETDSYLPIFRVVKQQEE